MALEFMVVPPARPSPKGKTLAQIRGCYAELRSRNGGESNSLAFMASAEGRGYGLSTALAFIRFNRDLDPNGLTNASREVSQSILDYWRQPLMVSWRSNIVEKAAAKLLDEHPYLIIWSKGANQSNEWGHGDDLFIKN